MVKKAAEYYLENKDILKENAKKKKDRNLSKEEKKTKRMHGRNRYREKKSKIIY